MATQTAFSCVLKVAKASGEDGASHPAASEGSRCGAPQPAAHDYLIIHGRLPTQLRAMACHNARTILKVYEECAAVPDERTSVSVVQNVDHMHSTEFCAPNLAALREHRHQHLPWLSSHHRCAVHRLRTAELATLKADAATDSFFNESGVVLASRQWSGACSVVVCRSGQGASESCMGERPEHVLAWRGEVMGQSRRRVIAAHNTSAAEVRMLHAWDACFTGDGRGDAPEQYHGPWCSSNAVVCKANCIEAALQMIMPVPEMYSRRSCHGHVALRRPHHNTGSGHHVAGYLLGGQDPCIHRTSRWCLPAHRTDSSRRSACEAVGRPGAIRG